MGLVKTYNNFYLTEDLVVKEMIVYIKTLNFV